jgi:hypothetical protein
MTLNIPRTHPRTHTTPLRIIAVAGKLSFRQTYDTQFLHFTSLHFTSLHFTSLLVHTRCFIIDISLNLGARKLYTQGYQR